MRDLLDEAEEEEEVELLLLLLRDEGLEGDVPGEESFLFFFFCERFFLLPDLSVFLERLEDLEEEEDEEDGEEVLPLLLPILRLRLASLDSFFFERLGLLDLLRLSLFSSFLDFFWETPS